MPGFRLAWPTNGFAFDGWSGPGLPQPSMSVSSRIKSRIVRSRPNGASPAEIARLVTLAQAWLARIETVWRGSQAEGLDLVPDRRLELAVLMTELADDLHGNSGLWRAVESANQTLFGTPLPGLWRTGDPALERFDVRRFQFFLDGIWPLLQPATIVGLHDRRFVALAVEAEAFFGRALAAPPTETGSVAALLDSAQRRGWEVKRKLVWFGTQSFLLRSAHADYVARKQADGPEVEAVSLTDDFLCQVCTGWSGLGALELLAERLALSPAERADLLGWQARHLAFYRVEALNVVGDEIATMQLTNLINDQPYRVRMEMPRAGFPFQPGNLVMGGLVAWSGDWYWSGAQQRWPSVPADFATIKRTFREGSAQVTYRYCPELAAKALAFSEEHHNAFVRFYGSDLAVFPNGSAMGAAEEKRVRTRNRRMAAARRPARADGDPDTDVVDMSFPPEVSECERGVAVFSQPVEGIEIMADFEVLCAGLRGGEGRLTADQVFVLRAFIEDPIISPAFVRRVVATHGARGLEELYWLPPGDAEAFERLLRRHKGVFYRPRLPDLTIFDD